MIKIETTKGKNFQIEWAGVSSIDGVLRFAVVNTELTEILATFTVPENCKELTRVFDEDRKTFTGYTVFRGVQINYDGSIVVSMSKI
jgi:hypothetical protein